MRILQRQQEANPSYTVLTNNPLFTQVHMPDKDNIELVKRQQHKDSIQHAQEQKLLDHGDNAMDMDMKSPAKQGQHGSKIPTTSKNTL
jgi:hypothetical protein